MEGAPIYAPVVDMGDTTQKLLTASPNVYGTGTGTVIVEIRGSATAFAAHDASPAWTVYEAPVVQSWRYVQVRMVPS